MKAKLAYMMDKTSWWVLCWLPVVVFAIGMHFLFSWLSHGDYPIWLESVVIGWNSLIILFFAFLMTRDKLKQDRVKRAKLKLPTISFAPNTVQYRANPGEIANIRPIDEIRTVLTAFGFDIFKGKYGTLAAVVERDGKGQSWIKNYWDGLGRVCRTEFIGDRGAIGTNGITNIYEYDQKGRLVADYQIIRPKDKPDQLFRGSWYVYYDDRPDNEFDIRRIEIGGKETYVTYDQRRARKCGH